MQDLHSLIHIISEASGVVFILFLKFDTFHISTQMVTGAVI